MTKPTKNSPGHNAYDEAWYRQPILWLGAAIFAASLAGCIWLIVLAMQNPDVLTHTPNQAILGVPADAPATAHSTNR